MRRIVLVAVLALVIGGAAWALWPATKWPKAFCVPVVRVVGTDVDRIATSFSHFEPVLTATQRQMVATLRKDVRLAAANAPTPELRAELNLYTSALSGDPSTLTVTYAISRFDEQARTLLRACGLRPAGR